MIVDLRLGACDDQAPFFISVEITPQSRREAESGENRKNIFPTFCKICVAPCLCDENSSAGFAGWLRTAVWGFAASRDGPGCQRGRFAGNAHVGTYGKRIATCIANCHADADDYTHIDAVLHG